MIWPVHFFQILSSSSTINGILIESYIYRVISMGIDFSDSRCSKRELSLLTTENFASWFFQSGLLG